MRLGLRYKTVKLYKQKPTNNTCWFYTLINFIRHSKLLRNHIMIAGSSRLLNSIQTMNNNLIHDIAKSTKFNYTCPRLTHMTLRSNIKQNNYKSKLRSYEHVNVPTIKTIGANIGQLVTIFKKIIRRLRLPSDTISFDAKDGYKLEGAFIALWPAPAMGHVMSGAFKPTGESMVLNSALNQPLSFNWTNNNKIQKVRSKLHRLKIVRIYVKTVN